MYNCSREQKNACVFLKGKIVRIHYKVLRVYTKMICRIFMKKWISSQKVETMAGVLTRDPIHSLLQTHLEAIPPLNP
jgi:hypothetical protein